MPDGSQSLVQTLLDDCGGRDRSEGEDGRAQRVTEVGIQL